MLGVHVLASGLLLPLAFPFWAKLILSAAMAGSLALQLPRQGWRLLPGSVVALTVRRDQSAGLTSEIRLRSGRRLSGPVLGATLVVPGLVVLKVGGRAPGLPWTVTVPGDALDPEDFRSLRVMLRWGFRAIPP
jgi:toxin CptA